MYARNLCMNDMLIILAVRNPMGFVSLFKRL